MASAAPRRAGPQRPDPRSSSIRTFASSHQLHQLSPRSRWLIAVLAGFLLLHAGTAVWMHALGPGFTPAAVAGYYLGDGGAAVADPFGAAATDTALRPARTLASLVEVAHFHLFAMPLAVFLAAHLFAMTGTGRTRFGGILAGIALAATLADIGAPFAVRWLGSGLAWAKLAAFATLIAAYGGMLALTMGAALLSLARQPAPPGSDDPSATR